MVVQQQRRALVCGAGGFIGAHLVRHLAASGYWVRGTDIKRPDYSPTAAHDFKLADLRSAAECADVVRDPEGNPFDEVYQLAADMGGMGFIHAAECEIMRNNCLINLNMIHAAATAGVSRYLLASSACIYRDMIASDAEITEEEAYPAQPDNEYGWEKLYAERTAMVYGQRYGMAIRLARLQNCYGPEGAWDGGREKAPAAICRKIAEAVDGGTIEVWGDGAAMRAYTYIDDMIHGIAALMASDLKDGVNIGRREYVSVRGLVELVADLSGKQIDIQYVNGPVGVHARNFRAERIQSTGWESRVSLREGLGQTFAWIESQVLARESTSRLAA